MLKKIRKVKNPEVIVITPLLTGHKVEKDLKVKINRNDIPFDWFQYEGNSNTAMNTKLGLKEYYVTYRENPKYFIKLDRDIIPGRHMLDKLVEALRETDNDVAYSYCSFEYSGSVNMKFPAQTFDPQKLLRANYISSMSMFKIGPVMEVGIVSNDKYKRLLDWVLLIRLLSQGYVGIPCYDTSFIAVSTEDDISAGTNEDYKTKYMRVFEDFIKPLFLRET